jgi:segregation and condensation protein A
MAEEPVEILVQMAERGEIDPWNIDIVEVTDRFLSELERRKELDLRVSGRTLFYAAILLRMKSEYLDQTGEAEIRRRLDRKKMRKSPVTLFELIIELKNIEKEQRRRQRYRAPFGEELIDADDVVSIAHDEGYQESALAVMCQCEDRFAIEGIMTIREIAELLGRGLIDIYIPLLFLMSEGKLMIWQDEFFGEIFVQMCRAEE